MTPDEQLSAAIADKAEAVVRRRRVAQAEERLRDAEVTLHERQVALSEEEQEVARLEKLSWTRIASSLRGRHASDLERETAEREAARYAFREAEVRRDQAAAELAAATARLEELPDTDAAYTAALAAKEEWLAAQDPAARDRLNEIAQRRGVLEVEFRESREADDAGVTASKLLAAAAERLSSAESWSTWDTFGGGGLLTDMVKHSRMDEARTQLGEVDRALKAFGRELADVKVEGVASLELSGALEAFDVWFDNIFSDWMVRNRIQDAARAVEETQGQVTAIVKTLRTRRQGISQELTALTTEREALLRNGS
ncbi:MAG: hypothetical protein J7518_11570 [Nocardioidaceae bacterium]|nr:hypothetical protein [Nocardioidaceae bacterium]